MAADLYGFDEESTRRIGRAVRADEASQPGLSQGPRPAIGRHQVFTFVRDTPSPLDAVTAETFDAIQVSSEYGYDFAELTVTCEVPRVSIPENAPRYEINHASFIEGCVFHGDLFQAVNIAGNWHAIGTAHTSIVGTYSTADGTLTVTDCNDVAVPVQVAIDGFELEDGQTYVAEWIRADRVYVVVTSGCEEE